MTDPAPHPAPPRPGDRVLVTGASGFLGRPVVHALLEAGYDVVTVGRTPVASALHKHVVADLLNPDETPAVVRDADATHLVHLAWHVAHHDFWTSSLNDSWVDASIALVRLFLAHRGRHVLAAGSCAEYAPAGASIVDEHAPIGPATRYGQAKVEAHLRIRTACDEAGALCTWGRIFVPYGPGDHPQRLVPSLIDVFRGRRAPFTISPGDVRDFIHVHDIASALVCLLQHDAAGTVNISTGIPATIASIADAVARACGVSPAPVLPPAQTRSLAEPARTTHWLVGTPSTLTQLGWTPAIPLERGLYSQVRADERSC